MRVEPTTNRTSAKTASASMTELLVSGMNCNNCARHVVEAIQSVPGVRSAFVILAAGRVSVRWAAGSEVNVSAVLEAIKQAGYDAKAVEAGAAQAHGEPHHAGWQAKLWIGVLGMVPLDRKSVV